jgi:hypothetical protein
VLEIMTTNNKVNSICGKYFNNDPFRLLDVQERTLGEKTYCSQNYDWIYKILTNPANLQRRLSSEAKENKAGDFDFKSKL